MPTQEEFESRIAQFERIESMRSQLYESGLNLIKSQHEIEAYILILSTWNFAHFRYIMRSFSLQTFRVAIRDLAPIFQRLSERTFREADFDELADDITETYSRLKGLVKQTGAAKIMHFKCPDLFVMWDDDIRKNYSRDIRENHHVPTNCSPQHYIAFLKQMQTDFNHLQWDRTDRTFAKAIDEYNFVIAHETNVMR